MAGCPVPATANLKQLEYNVERLTSSARVVLKFPDLSSLDCTVEKVTFGSLFHWELSTSQAVLLQVSDASGNVVQQVRYEGTLTIKEAPPFLHAHFFDLKPDKALTDHSIVRAELASSNASATPQIDVEDMGQRRYFPLTVTTY
jgi:hypothetical protein